jgi:O-antigen/teichoic acid export membrane protein
VAGALPMASAILLLPFYLHYLPTAVYGALALYLAASLFVQVIVVYSFDSSLYVHYHEFKKDEKKLAEFVSSVFIFMLLIGVAVAMVMLLLGSWVFSLVFDDQKISFFPFGFMAVGIGIFQAVFKVYSNLAQSREKPEQFFWSNLSLFSLIVALTIGGLYFFPTTLVGPLGSRVISGGVAFAWVLYQIFRMYGFHFNYALLKGTFSYNHYTFIYQVFQWAINYLDRFVMIFFLPLSAIGLYDFAVKCLIGIEFIINGLHSSFLPKVVGTIMEQREKGSTVELNRYYHGLISVTMVIITVGIMTLPFIVGVLDSKGQYKEAIQYFPYIGVLFILKAIRLYFGLPYVLLKYTKPLSIIYFIVSAIKILVMIVLMQRFGVIGVVISSLVGAGLEIILLKVGLKGKFIFQYNRYKLIIVPLSLLAIVLILEPFTASMAWVMHLLYVIIVLILLLWVYRNEIKTLSIFKWMEK